MNETIVPFMSGTWQTQAMDFARPVQSVIPGAQGRILAVLAETSSELNLRSIARLSGVSLAHTSRVMPVLVEIGVVQRREAPPSALFRFVPDNVASQAITALTRSRQAVLDEMGSTVSRLQCQPTSVVVFGSFASGKADSKSDIDVVVVRPPSISEDDRTWRQGIDSWRNRVGSFAGNRIEILEIAEDEVLSSLGGRKPLWVDIVREGILVFGTPLAELQERRSA